MTKDYNVIIVCYERNATYSHTVNTVRSEALDVIEDWCVNSFGLCEVINMRKVREVIKTQNT